MDFRNSLFIILIFNNQASLKLLWTGLRFTKLDYHTFFLVVFFHCKTANKWFDSRVVALVIPPLKPKVLPEQSLSFSIWIWTFGAATTQAHPFDQVDIGGWSDAWTGNGDVRTGTGSHVTGCCVFWQVNVCVATHLLVKIIFFGFQLSFFIFFLHKQKKEKKKCKKILIKRGSNPI